MESLLNRLKEDVKAPVIEAFRYVLPSLRLGGNTKATNFAWVRIEGVTSSNAGTEFSVLHGLDGAPSKLIPIVDLSVINSQLVPLVVSRAPDARRIYLTSSSTGATFSAYVE